MNSDREDSMAETATPTEASVTVCYNSACPVCRAGMERYQRLAAKASPSTQALPLGWRDINVAPDLFRQHGISFDMAMRRLYAFDAGGRMLRGIDVMVAIWRELPGYRWLAALAGSPALRPLAWFAYEVLVSYPIYRWSRRRWRRLCARQQRAAP